jgi:hypothetical protein
MSFAKDGFMPGEMVQMIIEVDNSQCSANVKTIQISVTNAVTMRSQGHSTSVPRTFFTKTINGLNAGESLVVLSLLLRVIKPSAINSRCL